MADETVNWAGRTFGQLTPDEQRRAARAAGAQLSAELSANAGAISAIMDDAGRQAPYVIPVYSVVREAGPERLSMFPDEDGAVRFIGCLPDADQGAYGIDYPAEVTPREVDQLLADLYEKLARTSVQHEEARDRIHHVAGDKKSYAGTSYGQRLVWKRTHAEVEETLRSIDRSGIEIPPWVSRKTAAELLKAEKDLLTELARIQLAIQGPQAVYATHRWTRFFPCTNANGHIHRSLDCSTLYPDTPMAWTPQLSGKSVADAVAELGPALCSVCFPEAPVEHRSMSLGDVERERTRGERDAAKAEREAKKAAKNLLPGEVITVERGQHGERITTVAAAKDALRREVELRDYYGTGAHVSHPAWAAAAELARGVLLAREAREAGTGATQEQIDKIIANAVKKNRAEGARI